MKRQTVLPHCSTAVRHELNLQVDGCSYTHDSVDPWCEVPAPGPGGGFGMEGPGAQTSTGRA